MHFGGPGLPRIDFYETIWISLEDLFAPVEVPGGDMRHEVIGAICRSSVFP